MRLLEATDEAIKAAAFLMRDGGVVVYPTETVYGIGCVPSDPDAAQRVCKIKQRADRPLPLICSDVEAARRVVEMTPEAEKLATKFWPGPLTMVIRAKAKYNMWVSHGASTLGVRVSSNPIAQKLAKEAGGVIVSTSANISGDEPAKSAEEAKQIFDNLVDIILDGGSSRGGESSTVVDLSGKEIWLLRKGTVSGEAIMAALRS